MIKSSTRPGDSERGRTYQAILPAPDGADIAGAVYPQAADFPEIGQQEIQRAIRHLSTGTAPGDNEMPNEILKLAAGDNKEMAESPTFTLCLGCIYNASIDLGYYPQAFRISITVPLRKVGKPADDPSGYRPIALLNTPGKVLEAIVAERIQYVIETMPVLPDGHYGGRKGRSTDEALHHLLEGIYAAWNKGWLAIVLSIDLSGAYDHVYHPRILHNMRKRYLGGKFARWTASFLSGRTTKMRLPDMTTETLPIEVGIPQGSPASPPLYVVFDGDLIDIAARHGAIAVGWIDDINFLATAPTPEEACNTLSDISTDLDR